MSDNIIRRIERRLGVEGIASLLGEELDPSDLQSLMLEVYRRAARRRSPKMLLADYRSSRFSRPSKSDLARLLEWDRIAFSNLPAGFLCLELSPLSPLGTVTSLTPINQDWIVSTIRNSEVTADSTNLLALECAVRRQRLTEIRDSPVNIAASQRVVRSQRYESPNLRAHFRLFSMCSAGRDKGNFQFEASALSEHIGFYIKCLRLYLGDTVPLRASIFDLTPRELHRTRTLSTVADRLGGISRNLVLDVVNKPEEAKGYYEQVRFHIYATAPRGNEVELVDGGDTDWTRKLLGNMKERLIISGIGTERLCESFGSGKRQNS